LASDSDNLFCATEKQIEQLILKGEIPSLSVAVARDGKIIWEKGFGLANKEKNIPATNHTKYKLASISKQLTATGLMILVERGLIDLDKPVNDYLGKVKLYARIGDAEEATVRRVVNHTSGMPLHSQHFYKTESYQPPPMDETISRYGILVTIPGERFQYSNLGYGLIGYVISRTSGKSYADFMHEEVFDPSEWIVLQCTLGKAWKMVRLLLMRLMIQWFHHTCLTALVPQQSSVVPTISSALGCFI
jgi:CubicO group peptidase (beta-lactamase class C family)